MSVKRISALLLVIGLVLVGPPGFGRMTRSSLSPRMKARWSG